MKDNRARRVLKRLARSRYAIDLALTRMLLRLRGEPRYLLRGSCRRCGCCCETPMISMPPLLFHLRSMRVPVLTWHRAVNGFEFLRYDRAERALVFRCNHWEPHTRQCDDYTNRPGLCRDYPQNLLYSTNPMFLDQCGFRALDRDAVAFREALDMLELSPETRMELERRLHLRDEPGAAHPNPAAVPSDPPKTSGNGR